MIRIIIAGDIRLYREGLRLVLQGIEGISVVAVQSAVEELGSMIEAFRPDVALIDMAMSSGLEAVDEALARGVKVVALTVPEAEPELLRCAEAGVSGYVTRDGSLDDLVQAIRDAESGELHCSPAVAGTLLRRLSSFADGSARSASPEALTTRESQVLGHIAEGRSNKEIARELHIGLATVKNHVHHLLAKLGVRTRAEAAVLTRTRRQRRVV